MKPLISYYGGKQRMSSKIVPLIPKHTVYVEPFCGGATLLFNKPFPKVSGGGDYKEVINDIDKRLINFYRQVVENGELLKLKIDGTLYSEADYSKSRDILNNSDDYTVLESAWAYYVNIKQSFSNKLFGGWGRSVIRSEGTTWSNNSDIAIYIPRMKPVHITCDDALKVIEQWDSPQTFFYCDPPYPGTNQGHYKGYAMGDFKRLVDVLDRCQGSFILSCYECCDMPSDWQKFAFKSICSASGKGRVGVDRSRKLTIKEFGDKTRTELVYRRLNKVPVREEIQRLYDSGRFDCFYGGRHIEFEHYKDAMVII